jgi:diaminopimelate epimerase
LVRAYLFDAAGNHVVLGWVDNPGLASDRVHAWLREVAWSDLTGKNPELFAVVRGRGSRVRASFWNPDGTRERLCGNAVRCIPSCLALGGRHRFSAEPVVVETGIGPLLARSPGPGQGTAELRRSAITLTTMPGGDAMVEVGTPHRVRVVCDLDCTDLVELGRAWSTARTAINATFVQPRDGWLEVRTFERGVAGETGSCGTGAIAACLAHPVGGRRVEVRFRSGEKLWVEMDRDPVVLGGRCSVVHSLSVPLDSEPVLETV